MSKKLLAAALVCCSTAYAAPNTKAVGSASVRGEMRVDGNPVTSNATLFDGSTVETAEASVTLNMFTHAVILMPSGSRGTVHDGYLTLEQGKIDFQSTCGFVIQADQIRVAPDSDDLHAVINRDGASVSVMVIDGSLLILDTQGRVINSIHKGSSQSFSAGQSKTTGSATFAGSLSHIDNHPLLTLFGPENNIKYEIQGHNSSNIQGQYVTVSGVIDPKRSSLFTQDVISESKSTTMCGDRKRIYPWIIVGAAAAGAAAIVVSNQEPTPASR